MKANELRIGNLLLVDGKETTVKGWMIHLIQIGKNGNKVIEPIPITEELLIRFGFEKIKHIHNGIYYLHKLTKISIYPNGMIELRGAPGFNKIHYVHQLQNLYFALTGEELKLTDK